MGLYPNLEAEMARNGVTQRDLSELLGKTPETVCKWMNGRNGEFTVSAAFKIAEHFFSDCSPIYLFKRSDAKAVDDQSSLAR